MSEQIDLNLLDSEGAILGAGTAATIGQALDTIRASALSEADKGLRFESLVRQVLPTLPEYDMKRIWRFADWPGRERLMGRDGSDQGIDLVAELKSGGWVAIQCKFWGEHRRLSFKDLATFFAEAAPVPERGHAFECLMVVATCPLTGTALRQLRGRNGRFVSFYHKHREDPLDYKAIKRPHEPLPRQQDAIDRCVEGLENHDRGRLVMACGTGKTFTSLRIAEAAGARRILFVAPSIALVAQARKEWLRQGLGDIASVIVCSDSGAGRGGTDDELGVLELDCPVTRNPGALADFLRPEGEAMRVVFCTHQSLRRVTAAQGEHGAPPFDLTVIDEAHWTTGVVSDERRRESKYSFQDVHSDEFVSTRKRLYMTATPRVYTVRSRRSMEAQGHQVFDMEDEGAYGPEFFRLSFRNALSSPGPDGNPMLCDYRVVVLVVPEGDVTPAMRERLGNLPDAESRAVRRAGINQHITRVYGTSLALNGAVEGDAPDLPDRLRRAIAFANTRDASRWYATALTDAKVRERTTRALQGAGRNAGEIRADHLDATHSAFERSEAIDRLRHMASDEEASEVLCNVKLFSEGVDVPSLDAVVFLEPRRSQVDVVQAVGRVMRRAPGKELGYIVIPVVVPEGEPTLRALDRGSDGYKAIGQVLRALQSHDGRLLEETARLVQVVQPPQPPPPPGEPGEGGDGPRGGEEEPGPPPEPPQPPVDLFEDALRSVREDLFARIVESSGLGAGGSLNAEDIQYAVERAGALFHKSGAAERLAEALNEPFRGDGRRARNLCKIAALLIANACLLHKRLAGLPHLALQGLAGIGAAEDPVAPLLADWKRILERDYRPVFIPAQKALKALPDDGDAKRGLRRLVSCANAVADSLSDLGYDHAGPLYHRILDTAASDGAYYTTNAAALLLAELALPPDFLAWHDPMAAGRMRLIDPACGTGTLLMAALKVAKERQMAGRSDEERRRIAGPLHKDLVENAIFGLDFNHQAAQLAASNLTLGAPEVDYQRMNVHAMPHGPQPDGTTKAGSLELLAGDRLAIESGAASTVREAGGVQVDGAEMDIDPSGAFNVVIMNPPFTNNERRGQRYDAAAKAAMRLREQALAQEVAERQGASAAALIDYNSVRTFFTPLADRLLAASRGTLAKVLPVTACTSASGLEERKFIADRFHVETLVTCHANGKFAFSSNTTIHECLMVCRRWPEGAEKPNTKIVVLERNPQSPDEVSELVHAIRGDGDLSAWGNEHEWPVARIADGDWSAIQWFDGELAEAAHGLERNASLEPLGHRHRVGPAGRRVRDAFEKCEPGEQGAVQVFESKSGKLRRTLLGEADGFRKPKANKARLAERYLGQASNLLVSAGMNTQSGILTGLFSRAARVGNSWIPVAVSSENEARGLAAWWNSTPCMLMLLSRRSDILTFPNWSIKHLSEVRVPKPNAEAQRVLCEAFDSVKDTELRPMAQAANDPVRQELDRAAARVLNVSEEVLAEWRSRLAREPTLGGGRRRP